jgi:ABC-type multidrug transport system fused ATPase/permease subunit
MYETIAFSLWMAISVVLFLLLVFPFWLLVWVKVYAVMKYLKIRKEDRQRAAEASSALEQS